MEKEVREYMKALGASIGPHILGLQNFQLDTEIGLCVVQVNYKTQKACISFIENKSLARETFGNHSIKLEGGEDFIKRFKAFMTEMLNKANN